MEYVAILIFMIVQLIFVWSFFPYAMAHFLNAVNDTMIIFQKPKDDIQRLAEGIHAMSVVMKSSHGVYGMDFNGKLTPWSELYEGGESEEWLWKFTRAQTVADRVLNENQRSYVEN